jgi:hypothetical protein
MRGNRESVVVVVPVIAEGEQRNPQTVGGQIARLVWTRTPDVRRGIDEKSSGQPPIANSTSPNTSVGIK